MNFYQLAVQQRSCASRSSSASPRSERAVPPLRPWLQPPPAARGSLEGKGAGNTAPPRPTRAGPLWRRRAGPGQGKDSTSTRPTDLFFPLLGIYVSPRFSLQTTQRSPAERGRPPWGPPPVPPGRGPAPPPLALPHGEGDPPCRGRYSRRDPSGLS